MRIFAHKQKRPQESESASAAQATTAPGEDHSKSHVALPAGQGHAFSRMAITPLETDQHTTLAINTPGDVYEQEADRVADRVVSGQSVGPMSTTAASGMYIQKAPDPHASAQFEPEIEAATSSAHVGVGKTVALHFRVTNGNKVPSGTTFDWRGIQLNESQAVTMVGFTDHDGTHATLVVKGQSAGIAQVGTTLHVKTAGGQEDDIATPRVRVEVGSEMAAAEGELAHIATLRDEGKQVGPAREAAAQQEAVAAAQHTLGTARHAQGTEIGQVTQHIGSAIDQVANARYRGYQDALSHLNLTQFDDKEQTGNAQSFLLSLAGNLLWALSGLIAISPIGLEAGIAAALIAKHGAALGEEMAATLASRLVQLQALHNARLATAVGVGGAMLAQFSGGLPSGPSGGGNVSGPLITIEQKLNEFNSYLFNVMRHSELYLALLSQMSMLPLESDTDAQQYAGQVETGIRRVLFGGYFENGGATGNQVNDAVIQTDARNQLLRRVVVSSGKIADEGVASTKVDEHGLGKMVAPAVSLAGGATSFELGDYELVVEQVQRAARELGISGLPKITAEQLHNDFATSDTIVFSASLADDASRIMLRQVIGQSYTNDRRWDSILELESGLDEVSEVLHLEIRKKDLTSAKIGKGGAPVYSAEKIRIRARGYKGYGQPLEDQFLIHQQGPVMVWLVYNT